MQSLKEIISPLLAWYDCNARILPWREEPTPYRVWISEVMLQQTRVEACKPYFDRFIREIPNISALAEADEQSLLKLWEGLGYYNRVRNLQKAAQIVVEQFNGTLPSSYESLRKLPGLGEYSAGSIGSIAFGLQVPAVDGNVLRVITRLTADKRSITLPAVKKDLTQKVRDLLPIPRIGDFNQSLMELGAIICLPNGLPLCQDCPLQALCEGYALGCVPELPVKASKTPRRVEEKTIFVLVHDEEIALQKRPLSGLLANMWEFPNTEGLLDFDSAGKQLEEWGFDVQSMISLGNAKHIFTHIVWQMTGYLATVRDIPNENKLTWEDKKIIQDSYPLPSAYKAYCKKIFM